MVNNYDCEKEKTYVSDWKVKCHWLPECLCPEPDPDYFESFEDYEDAYDDWCNSDAWFFERDMERD